MDKKAGAILFAFLILAILSLSTVSFGLLAPETVAISCIDEVADSAAFIESVEYRPEEKEAGSADGSQIDPAKEPTSPKTLAATAGNAQVVLTWLRPTQDFGYPITNYSVYRGTSPSTKVLLITIGPVLTYTDMGLTNGQTYYYVVTAWNSEGESPYSNEVSVIPATVPSAPQSLAATPGDSQVVLTWTAPSSSGGMPILNYTIYRGTTSGGETLLTTVGNVLSYTNTGLTNGQIYYYMVRAVNFLGEGAPSNEASATPATVPMAPQNLAASSGNAQVTLTWLAPANDGGSLITNYKIYRGTASGGETLLTSVGNVLTYLDLGLTNGQVYYYKVSAVNGVGEGPQSNEASATPMDVPSAPGNLVATAGNAQITLTWTAPSSDGGSPITNYNIYRGTASGGESLLTTVGNVLAYDDLGLANGQIYYYKVSAFTVNGEGLQSNEASATPATIPSDPLNLAATAGNAQIALTWSAPSSDGGSPITNYRLYRGTTSGSEVLLTTVGNVLTYTDTGLINGQIYYYKVSAVNSRGEGGQSNEASATPITVPGPPTLISATPATNQVTLVWTAPGSDGGRVITNYQVWRGMTSGSETLMITLGNVLTYTNSGLVNGQTYYYKVAAVNSVGAGALSNELHAMPVGPPTAPLSPNALPGDTFINITWMSPASDGGSPITNYQVWRSLSSGTESFFANAGLKLWFNDTGLTNGLTYYYKVAAENSEGRGPDSSEVFATPVHVLVIPTAPQNLAANPSSSQISLTWSAPASSGGTSITNYRIYRGTSPGGESLLITLSDVLSYTDTGLTNGQIYYYKVSAVNAVGEGPQSNEASATPVTIPSAPQSLSAAPGNAQITLTWTAPSSNGGSTITGYKVYRGVSAGGETSLTTLGNVLTYLDSGLTNGQAYYYKVSAINSIGEGIQSNEASAIPVTVPSSPTLTSSTPGNAQVTLSWSAPSSNGGSSITNYKIYRGTSANGEALLTTINNLLSFTDTGLTNGQTYYYKVSAVNSVGEGGLSNELNSKPTGPPTAPQNIQTRPGDAFINLTWLAPASDGGSAISNYQVMRGLTSGAETFLANAGLKLWYNDTGLSNGQTYFYKVRAVNALGAGPDSSEVSATPSQTATVPSAPQSLTAMASNAQVTLTWYAPSDNGGSPVTNYGVYRGTTSGAEALLTTLGDVLTYTDTGLTNGQTYHYKVSAINSVGEGPQSNEASATPATVPSAPQDLAASAGNAQVTLTWTSPSDDGGSSITSYVIYRGATSGGEVLLTSVGNVLTYLDTGLSNGQVYYYKVSAINAMGEGPQSDEASATPGTVPSAPQNLIAIPGDSFVNLTWMPPASDGGSPILNYTIYRGTAPGAEVFLQVIGPSLGYIDSGLTNGQTYYFKVSATSATGEGAQSNEASATPANVPSEPQNLTATAGDSEVNLTWASPLSDGGSPIIGYNLYRGTESENMNLLITLGNVLSHVDIGLTNGQAYFYKVSAWNEFGEGTTSAEASAIPATVPSAPRNLTASRGNAEVHLAWQSPDSDGGSPVTNYTIYRSIEPGTGYLLSIIGDTLNYTDSGVTNGLTYYYVVRAINALGEGGPSNEVSATPASVPSAPRNLTATPGISQVTLNWTAPVSDGGSQITNYTIYRGTSSGMEALLVTIGDALSYVDSSLANGQIYYYVISASSAIGEGPLSEEAYGTLPTTPSAPEYLTASSGDMQIALEWTSPMNDGGSSISSYRIYRGAAPGALSLLTTVGDVLAYIDSGLENGQVYYYMVSAVNSVGEGAPSNEIWATPSTVPSVPLGLRTLAGDRAIELNWTSPSYVGPGELYYHLLRDGAEIWSGSSTNFRDTQVTKGRMYSYQVSAQNSVGRGANSSAVKAAAFGPPDTPWGLMAVPGNGEVSLSWEEVNYSGPGLLTYYIYRDGWRIWSGNVTGHLDTSVYNGMTYSYEVAASNAIGWSLNSSAMSATPQGPPTPPTGLQARPGPGSVQLNWSAPAYCGPGSINYILFRDGVLIWSGEEREFEDSGLTENVAHSYTVVAYNSFGGGANSTSVQAVPLSTQSGPPPYWGLVTFLGFVGIAAIPMSMLAYRMYRSRYIRSVSMLPDMRCPSCGTIIPATAAKCPICGVRFSIRKIVKEKP